MKTEDCKMRKEHGACLAVCGLRCGQVHDSICRAAREAYEIGKRDNPTKEAGKKVNWIRCDDDLPKTNEPVLVKCANHPTYRIGSYEDGNWETGELGTWCISTLKSGVVISWAEIPKDGNGNSGTTAEDRKIGHWVVIDDHAAKCSVCGTISTVSPCNDPLGVIHKNLYHYCDWCGAKMCEEAEIRDKG